MSHAELVPCVHFGIFGFVKYHGRFIEKLLYICSLKEELITFSEVIL